MDEKNIVEEIQFHHISVEIIYHICDDNGSNLFNIEEEAGITSIN